MDCHASLHIVCAATHFLTARLVLHQVLRDDRDGVSPSRIQLPTQLVTRQAVGAQREVKVEAVKSAVASSVVKDVKVIHSHSTKRVHCVYKMRVQILFLLFIRPFRYNNNKTEQSRDVTTFTSVKSFHPTIAYI